MDSICAKTDGQVTWPPSCSPSDWRFSARPYGVLPEDLGVSFQDFAQPRVTTDVLQLCLRGAGGQRLSGEDIWSWTVGGRLQGLLAVAQASLGPKILQTVPCGACGEHMEIEIEWAAFGDDRDSLPFEWEPQDGVRLLMRVPTGRDQMELIGRGVEDWPEALAGLLRVDRDGNEEGNEEGDRPFESGLFESGWVESFSDRLAEADPMTVLFLQAPCPYCGEQKSQDLDLESLILSHLKGRQEAMLSEVHLLARHYHWTEDEILALPPWRRRRYLQMVGAERLQ